jgi:D-3-phosphoglycerate dehydrogenase
MKILVSDPLSKEGIEKLKSEDRFEVREAIGLDEDELIKLIPEYDALIIRSETRVTSKVIDAAVNLKVIGRAGTGVDNVDIEAATKKGIIVMNTPEGNTISAAEHTICMMLALSRNISQANASIKKGEWNRKKFMGSEVYGKILGIIGLGRIGREVATRAQGLKMTVIAYDPFISKERAEELGITLLELDQLLPRVDYLTLHVPLTPQTKNLIGEKEISLMKKGARIINCARGGIINEDALYQALKEGRLKGAALDVFEKGKPFDSPLLELDSVILTPHLGASTEEAQKRVAIDIVLQIIDALKNEKVKNAVNLPFISPQMEKKIGVYLSLSEKMGNLEAQLVEGHPKEVKIIYRGELANFEVAPLTVAFIKGMLNFALSETVNYVNALVFAEERGIKIMEAKTSEGEEFKNLISVTVLTDKEEKRVDGTIFEGKIPHIVRIDDYSLDFIPQGDLLICSNMDRPGVVGKIGTILGKYRINISGLRMGRKTPGEKNVSVYSLDNSPPSEAIEDLSKIKEILTVKLVKL